jgi:hypothetical protein
MFFLCFIQRPKKLMAVKVLRECGVAKEVVVENNGAPVFLVSQVS